MLAKRMASDELKQYISTVEGYKSKSGLPIRTAVTSIDFDSRPLACSHLQDVVL